MSLSSAQTNVNNTLKQIADLQQKDADEAKKENTQTTKLNKATEGALKAKTVSALSSKNRDIERAQKELASIQKKRADLGKKIVDKNKQLQRYQETLRREQERQQRKDASAIAKLQREQEQRQTAINSAIRQPIRSVPLSTNVSIEYDVFISHASEDKEGFVENLAQELKDQGLKVWYDRFVLRWGDSLRQKIDEGLSKSRFGIVVLSQHFFEKDWPQTELDGLLSLEQIGETKILPIWHNITRDEITRRAPTIVGKLAISSATHSSSDIAKLLLEMLEE